MIIVNDNRDQIMFSAQLATINIHTDGKKIMASFAQVGIRAAIIGVYSKREKAEKAIELLAQALEKGETIFYMPSDDDGQLNTTMTGGQLGRRYTNKTNGKTK